MVRVLIVDDARISRQVLRTLLQSMGHDIVGEAQSVQEAVAASLRLEPDVVFLDLGLTAGQPAEALDRIHAACPAARVIGCAPLEDGEIAARAMQSGARATVVRPFLRTELADILH